MKSAKLQWMSVIALCSCITSVYAENLVADAAKPYVLNFKPVLLDTGSSSSMTLGLDYDLTYKKKWQKGATSAGSDVISDEDVNVTIKYGMLDFKARGTLASSAEKNPNKLLEFAGYGLYVIDAESLYSRCGGMVAFETDQGFEKKQAVYALAASFSKVSTLINGDAGSILLNYGTVKPSSDPVRRALAGSLDSFQRFSGEISYSIPINMEKVRSIDFDYRHYQEMSPPAGIEAAGLDVNRLGLVRINLEKDFFLQYSRGSLPFDLKSERVVKIGWSVKLE